MTIDTEPMQRVELVPPPLATLPTRPVIPTRPAIEDHSEGERIGHGSVDQDVTIPTPRFARGTTPPPFVVPSTLAYTEIAPPARWGTVEEIVLLDRPRAAAATVEELPLTVPRRSLAPLLITAAVMVFVGAITAIALLAGSNGSSGDDAVPSPAVAVEPAPIVVPIDDGDDYGLDDADETDDVDFEMEAEAVEISDIDARILDLLEAGELPSEPETVTSTPRPRAPQARTTSKVRKGILMLGAKPPCRIVIDGRDTGLMTPQRRLRVPVGTHEITLVNDEYDLRETINVQVRPGKASKVVRDFSKRLRLGAGSGF